MNRVEIMLILFDKIMEDTRDESVFCVLCR